MPNSLVAASAGLAGRPAPFPSDHGHRLGGTNPTTRTGGLRVTSTPAVAGVADPRTLHRAFRRRLYTVTPYAVPPPPTCSATCSRTKHCASSAAWRGALDFCRFPAAGPTRLVKTAAMPNATYWMASAATLRTTMPTHALPRPSRSGGRVAAAPASPGTSLRPRRRGRTSACGTRSPVGAARGAGTLSTGSPFAPAQYHGGPGLKAGPRTSARFVAFTTLRGCPTLPPRQLRRVLALHVRWAMRPGPAPLAAVLPAACCPGARCVLFEAAWSTGDGPLDTDRRANAGPCCGPGTDANHRLDEPALVVSARSRRAPTSLVSRPVRAAWRARPPYANQVTVHVKLFTVVPPGRVTSIFVSATPIARPRDLATISASVPVSGKRAGGDTALASHSNWQVGRSSTGCGPNLCSGSPGSRPVPARSRRQRTSSQGVRSARARRGCERNAGRPMAAPSRASPPRRPSLGYSTTSSPPADSTSWSTTAGCSAAGACSEPPRPSPGRHVSSMHLPEPKHRLPVRVAYGAVRARSSAVASSLLEPASLASSTTQVPQGLR